MGPAITRKIAIIVSLNAKKFRKSLGIIQAKLDRLKDAGKTAFKAIGVAAAATGVILTALGISATKVAARTEVLANTYRLVGETAGISVKVLDAYHDRVRAIGIAEQEAFELQIKFIQSNLDLADSIKIARVAQNLAVVVGEDSATTALKLTNAIVRQRQVLLKSFGILLSLNDLYGKMAFSLGKTKEQLTVTEKRAAFLNAILEKGKTVVGAYTNAMKLVGKRVTSLPRLFQDAQNAIGKHLLPLYGKLVDITGDFLKNLTAIGNSRALDKFSKTTVKQFEEVPGAFTKLSDAIFPKFIKGGAKVTAFFGALAFGMGVILVVFKTAYRVLNAIANDILFLFQGLFIKLEVVGKKLVEIFGALFSAGSFKDKIRILKDSLSNIGRVFTDAGSQVLQDNLEANRQIIKDSLAGFKGDIEEYKEAWFEAIFAVNGGFAKSKPDDSELPSTVIPDIIDVGEEAKLIGGELKERETALELRRELLTITNEGLAEEAEIRADWAEVFDAIDKKLGSDRIELIRANQTALLLMEDEIGIARRERQKERQEDILEDIMSFQDEIVGLEMERNAGRIEDLEEYFSQREGLEIDFQTFKRSILADEILTEEQKAAAILKIDTILNKNLNKNQLNAMKQRVKVQKLALGFLLNLGAAWATEELSLQKAVKVATIQSVADTVASVIQKKQKEWTLYAAEAALKLDFARAAGYTALAAAAGTAAGVIQARASAEIERITAVPEVPIAAVGDGFDEDEALADASGGRRVSGFTSRGPTNIFIQPVLTFNAETMIIGDTGIETAAEAIKNIAVAGVKEAVETGELEITA